MPDGAWCSPKRLLLLLSLAALREAVGKVGNCRCRTNIGSGAWLAPLPGTLGSTAWTPTKPQSPTWPWTTSASCSSLQPWTSSWWWTSTTTWSRAMASSASGSVAPVGDPTKDSYIPLFSNRPQDHKAWRQRIVLYKKKLDLQKKSKEATLNFLTSLTGVSWRQVEHLVDKVADGVATKIFRIDLKKENKCIGCQMWGVCCGSRGLGAGTCTVFNCGGNGLKALPELAKRGEGQAMLPKARKKANNGFMCQSLMVRNAMIQID